MKTSEIASPIERAKTPDWATGFPLQEEVALKSADGTWATVAGYVEDPLERPYYPDLVPPGHMIKKRGRFVCVQLYDSTEILVKVEMLSPWKQEKTPKSVLGRIACTLGFHVWEEEVPRRGLVVYTGFHFLFFSSAEQRGVQHCLRASCNAKRNVYRWGFQGAENPRWRKDPRAKAT